VDSSVIKRVPSVYLSNDEILKWIYHMSPPTIKLL
jgi:hypothetical protein